MPTNNVIFWDFGLWGPNGRFSPTYPLLVQVWRDMARYCRASMVIPPSRRLARKACQCFTLLWTHKLGLSWGSGQEQDWFFHHIGHVTVWDRLITGQPWTSRSRLYIYLVNLSLLWAKDSNSFLWAQDQTSWPSQKALWEEKAELRRSRESSSCVWNQWRYGTKARAEIKQAILHVCSRKQRESIAFRLLTSHLVS